MKQLYYIIMVNVLSVSSVFAQRYDDTRTYDIIGLSDGDGIGAALMTGLPIILVGFLIAYFTMWNKKSHQNDSGSSFGCIGIIIMGIGAFFLLPLFAWIEFIAVNLITIGGLLILVAVIIYGIYSAVTKK